jgi:hypothetical protein
MQQRHLCHLEVGDTFRFIGEAGINTVVTDIDDVGCVGYETKEGWYYETPCSGIVMDRGIRNDR